MSIYKEKLDKLHTSVNARDIISEGAENPTSEWTRKKLIIIPVILAALLALTGAVIHKVYTIGYEMSDIISELKVGRYYLETTDGYDPTCYIEVFDDNKLQFFGIETKTDFDNGNYYDWSGAPVEYRLMEKIPFIAVNDAWDSLNGDHSEGFVLMGIVYEDEDTLCWSVKKDEYPNAKDYSREADKEESEREGVVYAHFVFEGADR